MNAYVAFDDGGTLSDSHLKPRFLYSRSLLDKAGIAEISLSPDDVGKAHQLIVKDTYRQLHSRAGSRVALGDWDGNHRKVAVLDDISCYGVTSGEYNQIKSAIEIRAFGAFLVRHPFGHGDWIIRVDSGAVTVIYRGGWLEGVDEGWDHKDAGFRAMAGGPALCSLDLLLSGLFVKYSHNEFSFGSNDSLWDYLGFTFDSDYQTVETDPHFSFEYN